MVLAESLDDDELVELIAENGAPVTEHAVPVAIFSAEESTKRLITIPAAIQKVPNPVPCIRHPDWLHRRVAVAGDKFKQNKLTDFFIPTPEGESQPPLSHDIENMEGGETQSNRIRIAIVKRKIRPKTPEPEAEEDTLPAIPDPSANYSAWIKAMRPRWKQRQDIRWNTSALVVVPSMFRGVKVKTSRTWDILQICPSKIAGRFILWLSVDGEIVLAPLRIPREMYIHLRNPKEDIFWPDFYTFEKVTHSLPRERPSTARLDTHSAAR